MNWNINLSFAVICFISCRCGLLNDRCCSLTLCSNIKVTGVITGATAQREKLCTNWKSLALNIKPRARNLGVLFDPDLNFTSEKSPKQPFIFSGVQPDTERQLLLSSADYCNYFSFWKTLDKLQYRHRCFIGRLCLLDFKDL